MFRLHRAQALPDIFHRVGDRDARQILHALVAEFAGDAQSYRRSVRSGQLPAVHSVGEKGLRVPGVGHVQAIP